VMHGVHLIFQSWVGLGQVVAVVVVFILGSHWCRRHHFQRRSGFGSSCWWSCVIVIVIIRQLLASLAVSSAEKWVLGEGVRQGLCCHHCHPRKGVGVAGIILSGLHWCVVPGVLRW